MSTFLFALTSFAGSFIQTVGGFGYGIFVMTIYPFILPSTATCVTVSGLLSLGSSTINTVKNRAYIQLGVVMPLIIGFVISSTISILFSSTQPDETLRKLLGIALILLGIYFIFFSKKEIKPPKNIKLFGFIAGLISGVTGGMFAMSGPPAVVYLLACNKDKNNYLANAQFYFTVNGIYALIIRIISGVVTLDMLLYVPIGLIAVFVGTFFGRKVSSKIKASTMRKIVYAVMMAGGIIMLF